MFQLRRRFALACLLVLIFPLSAAHAAENEPGEGTGADAFAQLDYLLPTPGADRTASGAPGPGYWQQRADYQIQVELDDQNQRIVGSGTITYHNRSPHVLRYLWLQLDQNRFRRDSDEMLTLTAPNFDKLSYRKLGEYLERSDFEGGFEITRVDDGQGSSLKHTIVKTMMRVDLPRPLAPGEAFELHIDWQHNVIDAVRARARGGYEYFEADGNYIYEISQWYPRMVAYTDYQGWQHKQFLGRGEFTLELGDYRVEITVPDDHIVAATGVLQNVDEVLTEAQRQRLEEAVDADSPVFVVTPEEAKRNQETPATGTKTWVFQADNVRDFAFASSRRFIWDAMGHRSQAAELADDEGRVMAMSFYPNEAEPLWSSYSTHAIIHTLETYSSFTFEYPYPVSISVNGPIGGMEYPMITFNKPRPYPDGTYWDARQSRDDRTWERSKYGLISVIIHEVGHNYFPMIVNSDERQWTWMDEGLNSFLQFLAEQAWEEDYPSRRGEPQEMVSYMISDRRVPIMTNSESLLQFGNNAYALPATALNVLRETVLGRELFDFAFREYARRWRFKRPTPADFFRTMEDASGVDLDWFWRGWFYGTHHVDIAVTGITRYDLDTRDPEVEKARARREEAEGPVTLSEQRNEGMERRLDRYPALADFYNEYDEFAVTPWDYAQHQAYLDSLDGRDKEVLAMNKKLIVVDFENIGGLPMPLPLRVTYEDGSVESMTLPAEIWRTNAERVSKLFISDQDIVKVELDPYLQLGDAERGDNVYPPEPARSRFQLFKAKEPPNPMVRQDPDARGGGEE